jgi:hypothetical protein
MTYENLIDRNLYVIRKGTVSTHSLRSKPSTLANSSFANSRFPIFIPILHSQHPGLAYSRIFLVWFPFRRSAARARSATLSAHSAQSTALQWPWYPVHSAAVTMVPSPQCCSDHGTQSTALQWPWYPDHSAAVTVVPSPQRCSDHGTQSTALQWPW